jgi:hypothetical protein
VEVCVGVSAQQSLAPRRGLFAASSKEQTRSGLTHAGFHALVGRIFAAALKSDFNSGRLADIHGVFREKLFLTQFSRNHFEGERQVVSFPLEWFQGV